MTEKTNDLAMHPARLKPARLRRICDPKAFTFKTTADLKPFDGLIGQGRALEALDLGARIDKPLQHRPRLLRIEHRTAVSPNVDRPPQGPLVCPGYNIASCLNQHFNLAATAARTNNK